MPRSVPYLPAIVLANYMLLSSLPAQVTREDQDGALVGTGVIELGLSGGRSFGTVGGVNAPTGSSADANTFFSVTGTGGPTAVLSVGTSISRHVMFVGELSYLPGGRSRATIPSGSTTPLLVETNTRNIAFEAAVHIRFPLPTHRKSIPYVTVGGATLQSRGDVLFSFYDPSAPVVSGSFSQVATQNRLIRNAFAAVIGAGMRIYVSRRFGFRAEAKGYAPTGEIKKPFGTTSLGVFIQFW